MKVFQAFPEPFTVRLTDSLGAPIAGQTITFAPSKNLVLSATSGVTDATGELSVRGRAGWGRNAPQLIASDSAGNSARFDLGFSSMSVNEVHDLVGEDGSPGEDGVDQLAPLGHVGEPRGLLPGFETLYFASDCAVRLIDTDGLLRGVAGTGTCGFGGDGADASSAQLSRPTGLAASTGRLFVADSANHRVRVINLDTGVIDTYAGGGAAGAPEYGDQGDPRLASLDRPGWLGIAPDGSLYIADTGHDRIRRVDPTGTTITTILKPTGSCSEPVAFQGCGGELGCSMAWVMENPNVIGPDPTLFVSGKLCGTRLGGTGYGIVLAGGQGFAVYAGGRAGGGAGEKEVEVRHVGFGAPPLLAGDDRMGNMVVADPARNRIWSVEATTGLMTPLLGDGTAASTGNYAPASTAQVTRPSGLTLFGGDVYFSDGGGHRIRRIVAGAGDAPRQVQMTYVGGHGESVREMDKPAQPFQVKLTWRGGAPAPGLTVDWEPGIYGRCRTDAPTSVTDADGLATIGVRVGFSSCDIDARFHGMHGSQMETWFPFKKTVVFEPSKSIFTVVNEALSPAEQGSPDLGVLVSLPSPRAMDDRFFISNCAVRFIDLDGWVSTVAGKPGTCGFAGDGQAGTSALLANPGDLSFDSTGNRLYIADTGNGRIRELDLATGIIRTVAGGAAGPVAGDGDGGPATLAVLLRPEHVAFDGLRGALLYVADNGHNRIRLVDLSTGLISAYLSPGSCTGRSIQFQGCVGPTSCDIATDVFGPIVAATICGSSPGGSTTGVFQAGTSGLVHIAGKVGGSTADGTPAKLAAMTGDLALNKWQSLHYAEPARNWVRILDVFSGNVSTVAGTGVAGYAGNYTPALSAQLSAPGGLSVFSDVIFVSDTGNNAVRRIRRN